MFKSIANIVKTASAFLQNGAIPPNTPPELEKQMADTNHLSSKKFFLAFSGFIILIGFYVFNIVILFCMTGKSDLLSAYPIIFTKTIEVFATIMAVYLGGQAIVDLRYNSSSNTESKNSININETYVANEKEEDYTLEVQDENK